MDNNMWLSGIMGSVVGDALGVPVEFMSREILTKKPVVDMREYGTHLQPQGTWSDDSSMILATMDSLRKNFNLENIMNNFCLWLNENKFTPFNKVFDIGFTTKNSIIKYEEFKDVFSCGGTSEYENGNGSLMRNLPICLFFYNKWSKKEIKEEVIIENIHNVSALTHAHFVSKFACGLHYFIVKNILEGNNELKQRIQKGIDECIYFYRNNYEDHIFDINKYKKIFNLDEFSLLLNEDINSSGYVVNTTLSVIWSLIKTNSFRDSLLLAVNLGGDTDTIASITGGLGGLYYGYDKIPKEWLMHIQKIGYIENLCMELNNKQ